MQRLSAAVSARRHATWVKLPRTSISQLTQGRWQPALVLVATRSVNGSVSAMSPTVDHDGNNHGVSYGFAKRASNESPPAFADPLFPEVSSRTSSSPNAGWTELNTDGACFASFFDTDVTYYVSHKYLLLRCVWPRDS